MTGTESRDVDLLDRARSSEDGILTVIEGGEIDELAYDLSESSYHEGDEILYVKRRSNNIFDVEIVDRQTLDAEEKYSSVDGSELYYTNEDAFELAEELFEKIEDKDY